MSSRKKKSSPIGTELWTDRYRPQTPEDIIGQDECIEKLCGWLDQYKRGDSDIKRCVLISGPSGVGKTSGAICVLESYGFKVEEFNASDVRTKSQIEESLYNLVRVKKMWTDRPIAIVMDEIDGIQGGKKKGGLSEIIRYINPNRGKGNRKKQNQEQGVPLPPMICICNNILERKLSDFRKDCLELMFKKPDMDCLTMLLNKVCKLEKLNLDDDAKELVVEYAQGDYRRLLNYLQSVDNLVVDSDVVLGIEEIEQCNNILGEKTLNLDLEESVRFALMEQKLTTKDYLRIYSSHKSQLVCSMYENYISIILGKKYLKPLEKLDKLNRVMDDIAYSDMIDKIMHKNQLWYLHKVHGLLSCYLPSNELKCKEKEIPFLNTSSSRSKFNQIRNSDKDRNVLSSKLKSQTGEVKIHLVSQMVLNDLLVNQTPEKLDRAIEMMQSYGMDYTYIKSLIKIDRLSVYPKFSGPKLDNVLKLRLPIKHKRNKDVKM